MSWDSLSFVMNRAIECFFTVKTANLMNSGFWTLSCVLCCGVDSNLMDRF